MGGRDRCGDAAAAVYTQSHRSGPLFIVSAPYTQHLPIAHMQLQSRITALCIVFVVLRVSCDAVHSVIWQFIKEVDFDIRIRCCRYCMLLLLMMMATRAPLTMPLCVLCCLSVARLFYVHRN